MRLINLTLGTSADGEEIEGSYLDSALVEIAVEAREEPLPIGRLLKEDLPLIKWIDDFYANSGI